MGNSKKRPGAASQPPELNNPTEILEKLLRVEIERLETAQAIEKERELVFPETSIIIRDIQKLMNALNNDKPGSADDDLSKLPGLDL